jgi:hypothetical protein
MEFETDQASLAYAQFDLWITLQLQQLVASWIAYAAPCDVRSTSASFLPGGAGIARRRQEGV